MTEDAVFTLREVVKLKNETLEDQCKRLLDDDILEHYFDSYAEKLAKTEHGSAYEIHDNVLYYLILNSPKIIYRRKKK